MKRYLYIVCIVTGIIAGVSAIAHHADAASLSADAAEKKFEQGKVFDVLVHISSDQQVINAVEAAVTYPADMLEVIGVSRGGSFLTLWPEEPAVDREAGVITMIGGIPSGSYVSGGIVVTITFQAFATGGVEIGFQDDVTHVLLNDGLGTEAPLTLNSGIVDITPATSFSIISPTHPSEKTWYRERDFTVNWTATPGAGYSYVVSDSVSEIPDDDREDVVGTVTFLNLADGVHYFILREKLPGEEWKIAGSRRVMIDGTSPGTVTAFSSAEPTLYGGKAFIVFSATDKMSGIDHYDVYEAGTRTQRAVSPHVLQSSDNLQTVRVVAYDVAGNSTTYQFYQRSTRGTVQAYGTKILFALAAILLLSALLLLGLRSNRKR
ncbi:MAG: cohesin domain-containing protein [Patescibacteria group bacterium]|nr:cohesin domain-containing protein [Patescibacteria group bacterium]MDD5715840.1 cohesin domain-containing protein [Patescibacteria group bacterium]